MRPALYYLLSFLSALIAIIGFIGLKITIIAVAIGIALLTQKYIGDFGTIVGWIIGLCVGGLLFMGLERLSPYLEKLEDYTKNLKRYPYTEKYGKDFPQPKPENFGIGQTEFQDYNKRFQFEFLKFIFTYGLWITACIYVLREKIKGPVAILLPGGACMVAIILNYLFEYWNKRISRKHPFHEKINRYQEALKIFYRIRDENFKI